MKNITLLGLLVFSLFLFPVGTLAQTDNSTSSDEEMTDTENEMDTEEDMNDEDMNMDEETNTGEEEVTNEEKSCAGLRGSEQALCRLEMNIEKNGEEMPECTPGEKQTSLQRAYCRIKSNAENKQQSTTRGTRSTQRLQNLLQSNTILRGARLQQEAQTRAEQRLEARKARAQQVNRVGRRELTRQVLRREQQYEESNVDNNRSPGRQVRRRVEERLLERLKQREEQSQSLQLDAFNLERRLELESQGIPYDASRPTVRHLDEEQAATGMTTRRVRVRSAATQVRSRANGQSFLLPRYTRIPQHERVTTYFSTDVLQSSRVPRATEYLRIRKLDE